MRYYLENVTFGFNPDHYLFDTKSAALDHLCDCIGLENADENERKLGVVREYRGEDDFREVWVIKEVFDWENRIFGDTEEYLITREHGFIGMMSLTTLKVFSAFSY